MTRLGFIAKPRGDVRNGPDGGVIEAPLETDGPERGKAVRYADAEANVVPPPTPRTDHWGGLGVLTERFPDARVFALDGIADQVRARGPARLDGLRRTYGDKAATKVTVPTETIAEGPQRIDGITYDFKRFVDAESDLQLACLKDTT